MSVLRRIFVAPLTGLFDLGPHNRAHVPALRAAGAVAVPLLLVWASGNVAWAPFVAFGAMAGIYGRDVSRRQRAAMQLQAGAVLVLCVVLGTMVSMHPQRDWVVVVGGAIVAGVVSVAAALLRWGPPGPLFQLFGFAVCANTAHSTWPTVAVAGALATGSVLFAVALSLIGRREAEPWPASVSQASVSSSSTASVVSVSAGASPMLPAM